MATVIDIYTTNSAQAMGLGEVTGSIEIGKSADLIIVDRHLFQTPSEDLAEIKVLSTFFEGKLVFERG